MENYNHIVSEYVKSTKNTCLCVSLSIFLILLFIISPLNKILLVSFIGKICIVILLIYSVYILLNNTWIFMKDFNIQILDGSWNQVKSNVICSYIFSIFLVILLVYTLRMFM